MRLDVMNHTSYPDAPVRQIEDAVAHQLWNVTRLWPGAHHVVADLERQGFYIELIDDMPADMQGALGAHWIDDQGRPVSQVAVNPSLQNGSDWLTGNYSVASVVGHEAIETVGDPITNVWRDTFAARGQVMVIQELCDPVEDITYKTQGGVDVTNFVLPSWFDPFGKRPFDYAGVLDAPFSLSPGGYMVILSGGTETDQWGRKAEIGRAMPSWRRALSHPRAAILGVTDFA